ncbi:MAG: UDP-N-acetylmuramate--L-alanine ligase [Chloroflexota bacterium]
MTTAAQRIGAGLDPARPARAIPASQRIHVIGAAGAGASAAAILAVHAGATVTACDPGAPSPYTPAVEALGIVVAGEHAASHVRDAPRPDRVAVTKALTAIAPDHPELAAAREAGIPLEPWQQVVADAAVGRTLVGVAGTHGKSTTSGWLVHTLVEAGADPSAFVGALLPGTVTGGAPATARNGNGPAFVVEADEYAGNFDAYRPDIAILTGAEWDHPDVFADSAAVAKAFEGWLRRLPEQATLVVNVADPGARTVVGWLSDTSIRIVAYALADDASGGEVPDRFATRAGPATSLVGRILATEAAGTTLEIQGLADDREAITVRLTTAGRHNAANALAVAAAAAALGLSPSAIAAGLATFTGVGRRLERKGEAAGVVVYDDYGHHPTAIAATLDAVRQREPGRRVWAVYEPLTFHRTAAMLRPFAEALARADAVAIADIWAGRDTDLTVVSAADLATAVANVDPGIPVLAPGSVEATADTLAREVRSGDVVLVMGGGASYRIGERLLERLEVER